MYDDTDTGSKPRSNRSMGRTKRKRSKDRQCSCQNKPGSAGPATLPAREFTESLHSVTEFGHWIRNADVKAALLGAIQGLLITALVDRISLVGNVHHLTGAAQVLMAATSALLFVSLVGASLLLMSTQLPALDSTPIEAGGFSFPAVARLRDPTLLYNTREDIRAEQAWRQAWTLSRIAVRKYRRLRLATLATAVAVCVFVVWISVGAVTTTPT